MRILQVATLVTPDGAYGGPVRVALNQLEELRRQGHDVELVAGTRGFSSVPTELQGVPAKLFPVKCRVPGTGFAGLSSPALNAYLRRRTPEVDVVHVHMARDLITLPAAAHVARSSTPLVIQPHGMIDESTKVLAKVIDARYTRRILRESNEILALTPIESASLRVVADQDVSVTMIANGVPETQPRAEPRGRLQMLFLARLHPRKRAVMFVEAAGRLLADGMEADFAVVGPDEGEAAAVQQMIDDLGISDHVRWEGSLAPDATLGRLGRASVYVLPSVGEVLSMSILEAMSLGIPVIITTSNGLAGPVSKAEAGLVVDPDLPSLVAAMQRLADDSALRQTMGANAHALVTEQYSIGAVGRHLESIYRAHGANASSHQEKQ